MTLFLWSCGFIFVVNALCFVLVDIAIRHNQICFKKNVVMPLLSSKMSTRSVKFPSRTQSRNFNRQTINKFRNRSAFRHLNQLQYHIELHHGIPNRTRAPRALRRQNCRRHRYIFLNNLKAKNFMF